MSIFHPDGQVCSFGRSGESPAELRVHDWRFFGRLLRAGDIGLGESYMDGEWSTPDLVRLTRLYLATPFAGGRHQKRIDKIAGLEKDGCR